MDLRAATLASLLALGPAARAQLPLERMVPDLRVGIERIIRKPDFTFQTQTPPVKVRLPVMDRLFDHPRLAAAMWRHCQFSPPLYAFEGPGGRIAIDDGKGLRGTLWEASRQPGERVFYIEGRVDRGRMGNPFPVGARMVVVYKYWEGPRGYESHLQTWTALDSALLAILTRPWRSYVQRRQQEFIAYIMNNMAQGGAFAEVNPLEFRGPLRREGDPVAIRQFEEVFGHHGR